MKNAITNKFIFAFWALAVIIYFPNFSLANDNLSFMDFSWNDDAEIVKKKMDKNGFDNLRCGEVQDPRFADLFNIDYLGLGDYSRQMSTIDVELPSSLLFTVCKGSLPQVPSIFNGSFYISNAINKLTFCHLTISTLQADNIEGVLIENYGTPSHSSEYKLWQKGEEKLFLMGSREMLYLNENHLKRAISAMTSGVNEARSRKRQMINSVFLSNSDNTLCLQGIRWDTKEDSFKKLIESKQYSIEHQEKTYFDYGYSREGLMERRFSGGKILEDFKKKANPKFLKDYKIIIKYIVHNEDKRVPISNVHFCFSSLTQKLLYYIVNIELSFHKKILAMLDTSIGSGKVYKYWKYWNRNNIYIFERRQGPYANLLYFNKNNISEHVSLVSIESEKEAANQQQEIIDQQKKTKEMSKKDITFNQIRIKTL